MKDINDVKKLLKAFYEANTSVDEERLLREYFSRNDLPEEMKREQEVFNLMFSDRDATEAHELENRLSDLIDRLVEKDTTERQKPVRARKKKLWIEIGGIAASICLLVSVGTYVLTQNSGNRGQNTPVGNPLSKLTPEDRRKVIEAQKALQMVSENFNKGIEGVQSLSDNL